MRSPGSSEMHSSVVAYGASSRPNTALGACTLPGTEAQPAVITIESAALSIAQVRSLTLFVRGPVVRPPDAPILRQERPALMVPPAAGNLDVPAGEAFARETSAADQGDR